MAEEVVATVERLEKLEIQTRGSESTGKEPRAKRVKFKRYQGVTLAESLPFGLMRIVEVDEIKDEPG